MSYQLDERLNSKDSLAGRPGLIDGLTFDSGNDRGAILSTKVRNLSFNQIEGGTAILGGTLNGNGVLLVKNQGGTSMFVANGSVIQMLDAGANIAFILNFLEEFIGIRKLNLGGTIVGTQAGGMTVYGGTGNTVYSFLEDQANINRNVIFENDRNLLLGGTTTPTAPSGSQVKLYTDVSGGKTRLMARFGSGTAVQVSIEP